MEIKFTKMHGLGNDYIYINGFEHEPTPDPHEIAKNISRRHFSVGGDGLVLIERSYVADAKMRMFNADGSEAEMCGNAIRCVAKYVYEHGIKRESPLKIETKKGVLTLQLETSGDVVLGVRVDMGEPVLQLKEIPVNVPSGESVNIPIEIQSQPYVFTAVSMGNPHAVIYVDDVGNFPVRDIGPIIETHEYFPNKVNVEFVEIVNEYEVRQRTWERGSGETLACGTGASAVCVAGILSGKTKTPLTVHLLGGDLKIEWGGEGESVFMTGPAEEVFTGVIEV